MLRPGPLSLTLTTLALAFAMGCVRSTEIARPPPIPARSHAAGPAAPPAGTGPSAVPPPPDSPPAPEENPRAEGREPLVPTMAYPMAQDALQKARKVPEGPKRTAAFLAAAVLCERALGADPAADQAPEAAIMGAFAYKQAGEYTRAVDLYRLFLARYAAEDKLAALEATDPPRARERLRTMRTVTEALGAAYILMFDYASAAAHFDAVARQGRFDQAYRRDAAQNAAIVHANLGAAEKAAAAREIFARLGPDARAKANVDMVLATAGFHAWAPSAADTADVRAARKVRQKALEKFVATYERTAEAAELVVEAAYRVWQTRRGDKDGSADTWCKKAEKAYDTHFRKAPSRELPPSFRAPQSMAFGSRAADQVAECVYRRAESALRAAFPPDGLPTPARAADLRLAHAAQRALHDKHFPALKPLVDDPGRLGSAVWAVEARARQGALEDAVRKLLESAAPPKDSAAWKERATALPSAEDRAARRDLEASSWAAGYGVFSEGLAAASRRLALFADRHGAARLVTLQTTLDRPPFETWGMKAGRPLPPMPLGKTLAPPALAVAPPVPAPSPAPPRKSR